jgi:hypothetical protein
MAGEAQRHWFGRVAAWLVFALLALLAVAALGSKHPITVLPVATVAGVFTWLVHDYPRSKTVHGLYDDIDESAPDWPQVVPLGEIDDEAAEEAS